MEGIMDKLNEAKSVLAQYEKLKTILYDFYYENQIGEVMYFTTPECAILAEYLINKGYIIEENKK